MVRGVFSEDRRTAERAEVTGGRMDKLVFITLSLTKGGAERVICNMCNEYFADRYDVTVISLMRAEPEYRLDERIRLICVDRTEEESRQNLGTRFLRRRKALAGMLRQMEAEGGKPCAVISFLPEPNMIACSLRRALRLPLIISVRNAPSVEYRGKVRYLLMRLLYPKADAYVFQTNEAKKYFSFSGHMTSNSTVIPNPLASEFMAKKTGEGRKREQGGTFRVLAVGRLEAQKNYERLLAVFETFYQRHADSRLVICGEGSEREMISRYIAEHGLKESVFLPGNTDDMPAQYAAADAFIMTSDYEGMPNALLEAMACGLPVISTDCPCGAPAELIESEKNGILVPMGDEEQIRSALSAGLERIYGEPEFAAKLGDGAEYVRTKFSPERIYAGWDALIARTAGREDTTCAE